MRYLCEQIVQRRREKVDLKYTIAGGLWFNSLDLNYIGFYKEYTPAQRESACVGKRVSDRQILLILTILVSSRSILQHRGSPLV